MTKVTLTELRKVLHERVKRLEPVDVDDVAKVNLDSRTNLMKEKTRELMAQINDGNTFPEIHEMLDIFDLLAMDWGYSNAINWTGSMADKQAHKIIDLLGKAER